MGIEVQGVEKRFGSVVAVQDFSLRAERGELLAIVGPSGCGKTTLLRMIAGLEQADTGQVFIGGEDATRWPPDRRNVGFVFQQFALFPNMNVAENIGYGLRRRRVPTGERQRRVAELLTMIGMEQYGARRPHELSAGQQQRVALARALAPEPRTLLLDEPLSALDAAIRYQLRDELRRVQQQVGITTVLVTHDQEEALAVADRVAVMHEGRLEQIDSPWAVYDRPRTRFVAGFIGRANFLAGEARSDGIWLPGLGLWPAPFETERYVAGTPSDHVPGTDFIGASGASNRRTVMLRPESVVLETPAGREPGGIIGDKGGVHGVAPRRHRDEIHDDLVRPDEDQRDAVRPSREAGTFRVRGTVRDIIFGGERVQVHVQLHTEQRGDADGVEDIEGTGGSDGTDATDGMTDTRGAESPHLIAAVPSGAVPGLERGRGKSVIVVIPHEALRLLPD